MKELYINWLGSCENCGSDAAHKVESECGSESMLWDGDIVTCEKCGHKGVIECDGENAYVAWNED